MYFNRPYSALLYSHKSIPFSTFNSCSKQVHKKCRKVSSAEFDWHFKESFLFHLIHYQLCQFSCQFVCDQILQKSSFTFDSKLSHFALKTILKSQIKYAINAIDVTIDQIKSCRLRSMDQLDLQTNRNFKKIVGY